MISSLNVANIVYCIYYHLKSKSCQNSISYILRSQDILPRYITYYDLKPKFCQLIIYNILRFQVYILSIQYTMISSLNVVKVVYCIYYDLKFKNY